jgi:hypothetical protein
MLCYAITQGSTSNLSPKYQKYYFILFLHLAFPFFHLYLCTTVSLLLLLLIFSSPFFFYIYYYCHASWRSTFYVVLIRIIEFSWCETSINFLKPSLATNLRRNKTSQHCFGSGVGIVSLSLYTMRCLNL